MEINILIINHRFDVKTVKSIKKEMLVIMIRPKMTIITVVKNAKEQLEKTISNILNQTYRDYEYIVIDGDSKDGTVDVIRQFEKHITHWISEPDGGIAEAFNKGIEMASGEWINFMNAGDIFFSLDTLLLMSEHTDKYGGEFPLITGFAFNEEYGYRYPDYIPNNDMGIFRKARQSHQSSFFRKSLFEKYGSYDSRYKICIDYEYLLRILDAVRFKFIEKNICIPDLSGVSSNYIKTSLEDFKVEKNYINNFGTFFQVVLCHFTDFLRRVARKIRILHKILILI